VESLQYCCNTRQGALLDHSYNRGVRIAAVLLLIVSLAACNGAKKNNDAVRQGVVDYLTAKGFDIPKAMTVAVTNLEMKGDQADVTVSITPTGGAAAQGMNMKYHLEQKGDKWAVVARQDSGATPHGAGAIPAAPAGSEPHGGGAPPAPGATKMPSPDDLPPAKKQ
jgi:hypothetical protein